MIKKSKIANTIKKFRINAGLTQKELANKLFISDKAVSKWERGLSYPDVTLIGKLSKIFGVDSDAIFIDEDKHMVSTWRGILYVPNKKNGISIGTKLCGRSIFSLCICYFLLVNIKDILVVYNDDDLRIINKEKGIFIKNGINITLVHKKKFFEKKNFFLSDVINVMLIYDLIFVYGVSLTSTFQRVMMETITTVSFEKPKLPVVFGKMDMIINMIKHKSFADVDRLYKMFRGYIAINLNSKKNVVRCIQLIKEIEQITNLRLYDPLEIIKLRRL